MDKRETKIKNGENNILRIFEKTKSLILTPREKKNPPTVI